MKDVSLCAQDRLAALDLDSKRSRFEQSTAAYEAAKVGHSSDP